MDPPARRNRGPAITRSIILHFVGDWGQANFHRICSWIAQEFNDRSGPQSRVAIWTVGAGGIEAVNSVYDGSAQLAIATPAGLIRKAMTGGAMFSRPMASLRALAVLPQDDRMVLAVHPKWDIKTFDDLRRKRPPLRIATSTDDGTSFIGHVAMRFMEAHGISQSVLRSWGGEFVTAYRPEESIFRAQSEEVDGLLQEAIMTSWWRSVVEQAGYVAIPAESTATKTVSEELGLCPRDLPAGYWNGLDSTLHSLDFSDFLVLVRDDLPEDVAYLLTWILIETRGVIEQQYRHLPQRDSPLSCPLDPYKMAATSVPLHPAAKRCYQDLGYVLTE